MPMSVRVSGTWRTVTDPQVRVSGTWRPVQSAWARVSGTWRQVYTRSVTTTETFTPSSWQTYWESGNFDNQARTLPEHIQGTFDNTTGNRRRTLIFMNSADLAKLSGATNVQVKVRLRRVDGDGHGVSTASNVSVWTHNFSSAPSQPWNLQGLTFREQSSATRGQLVELDMPAAVGQGLANGTIKGFAVNTTSTNLANYTRYVGADTRIIVTYTK